MLRVTVTSVRHKGVVHAPARHTQQLFLLEEVLGASCFVSDVSRRKTRGGGVTGEASRGCVPVDVSKGKPY